MTVESTIAENERTTGVQLKVLLWSNRQTIELEFDRINLDTENTSFR